MKSNLLFKTLAGLNALLLFTPALGQLPRELGLTEDERAWIRTHATLIVGHEIDWAPYSYTENGQPKGLVIDIVRLVEAKTGLQFRLVPNNDWDVFLEQFMAGEIDIMPALYDTPERRTYAQFTTGYWSVPVGIVVDAARSDITDISSLADKRVAAVARYSTSIALKWALPDLEMVFFENDTDSMQAVASGYVDAYVTGIAAARYVLADSRMSGLDIIEVEPDDLVSVPEMRMAVGKENSILNSILSKGIDSISALETRQIANRWLPKNVETGRLALSDTQKQWLREHPVIRVGVNPSFSPYSFIDQNGDLVGAAIDLIELISTRLGTEFQIVGDRPPSENVSATRGGAVDVITSVIGTAEREGFPNLTQTYLSTPLVIMTREKTEGIVSGQDLNGYRVAIVNDHPTSHLLSDEQPGILAIPVDSPADALKAVATGRADAFVGTLGVVVYESNINGIAGLKVAGSYGFESRGHRFAVRDDWPELAQMLTRAIAATDERDRARIFEHWFPTSVISQQQDYSLLLQFVAAFLFIVFVMVFYVRKLRREIELRKSVEGELVRSERLAAVGRLTATVSHELRNPLGAINNASEVILRLVEKKDSRLDRALGVLKRSLHRCDSIIEDLLDFSRVKSLNRSAIAIDEWLGENLDNYDFPPEIALRRDLGADIEVSIDCDRLERAVRNVLDNACQAMQKDVEPDTEAQNQQLIVASRTTDQRLEISIKDTGVGISAADGDRVFEPLFTTKAFGVGLGLPMVKQIMEQHEGGVELRSVLNQGAEIILWLPKTVT